MADTPQPRRKPKPSRPRQAPPGLRLDDLYAAWADDQFGDRGLTLPLAGVAKCYDAFGLLDNAGSAH